MALGSQGEIRLYRFNGKKLSLLAKKSGEDEDSVNEVRISPDGSQIAAISFKRIRVLNGSNLSLAYAVDTTGNKGDGYGYFNHSKWSLDGKALYSSDYRMNYIYRWSNQGKGALQIWANKRADEISYEGITPLPNGKMAFTGGKYWGVLNSDGSTQVLGQSGVMSFYTVEPSEFLLSADGTQVRFGDKFGHIPSMAFDIINRTWLMTNSSEMYPPYKDTSLNFDLVISTHDANGKLEINKNPFLEKLTHQYGSTGKCTPVFPNGDGFVITASKDGGGHTLYALDRNGIQRWKHEETYPSCANISQDGRFVVAIGQDGIIRWYRASDGVEQLAFFPHPDQKRWIMWTPEGYYDASPGAEDLIGWHLNQGKDKEARFISSGQLYDVFFRPDIVQAKFKGEDISSMITITAAQALKMPPPILSFTKVPSTTKLNTEKVCYKAVATGGGIGEVRLFQNGKLIKSDGFYRETVAKADTHIKLASMDSAALSRALKLTKAAQKSEPPMVSNSKGNEYTECQDIETIPGDNEISVAAFNANNTVQSSLETMHFTSSRKPEAPHLYVLGIGINKYTASENNLSYAVKDATDFRGMIQDKAKGLFDAANIHIEGLSDAAATKAGIQQAIAAISAKVKPWDSFILFVASHGYLQDNQYYIVTADFNGEVNTDKMISSNEIVGMSKNIKSLSQLLIFDTCHAGGVDNIIGGLYDARMSVMAKKMGLHIYASAGSTQSALDGYKGNGLFTHALLKSMRAGSTTDSNHDSEVSVAELGESAKLETMDISKKLGFPQSPNIINFGKDNALFRVK